MAKVKPFDRMHGRSQFAGRTALLIVVLSWLALLALPTAWAGKGVALSYDPTVGESMVYRVTSRGEVSIDYAEWARSFSPSGQVPNGANVGMNSHSISVEAELHVRPVAKENGLVTVAGRLQRVLYQVDKQQDYFAKLFEAPFVMTYRENGKLEGMSFAIGLPDEIAGVIRALVEPMQMVFPKDAHDAWQGKLKDSQSDSTVMFRVTRSADGDGTLRLSRRLVSQERFDQGLLSLQLRSTSGLSTKVLSSEGEVIWSPRDGSLVSMTANDTTQNLSGAKVVGGQHLTYTASRVNRESVALPKNLKEADLSLRNAETLRLAQYWVPAQIKQKVQAMSLGLLVANMEKNALVEGLKPGAAIKFYLRQNPSRVRDLTDYYRKLPSGKENAQLVAKAFAAIGAAGHDEAQQGLVNVLSDGSASRMVRDAALRGLMSITLPTRSVLPVVWAYRETLPTRGSGWKLEKSIATNVYGSLGGIESLNTDMTTEVVKVLGTRLLESRNRSEQLMCLTALGNVGDLSRVLPLTEPYFRNSDPDLRRRAFHTFLKALGDDAFTTFAVHYSAETDISVLRTASEIASSMPSSDARNRWATAMVRQTEDAIIRDRLVRILGDTMHEYPGNAETLRDLLRKVEQRETRKTIYRYVSPLAVTE